MKTIMTLLTTTMLLAGASAAMAAGQQARDHAANNALTWRVARESSGAYAWAGVRPRSRSAYAAAPDSGVGSTKVMGEAFQASDSAKGNEKSWRMAREAGLARSPYHMLRGDYGSAAIPHFRGRAISAPSGDFQSEGGRN